MKTEIWLVPWLPLKLINAGRCGKFVIVNLWLSITNSLWCMIPIIVYFPQLDFSGFDAECSYKGRWKSIVEACWNWLCVINKKKSIKFTAINYLIRHFSIFPHTADVIFNGAAVSVTAGEMSALLRTSNAGVVTWRHCRYLEHQARLINTTAAAQKLHKKQPRFVHGEKSSVSKLIKSHNSFLKRHIGPSSDELLN